MPVAPVNNLSTACVILGLLLAGCTGPESPESNGQPASTALPPQHTQEERISRPFEYRGYSKPQFSGSSRSSAYIAMTDGARIAADIYIPDQFTGAGAAPDAFPVIFIFTPYMRASFEPGSRQVEWTMSDRPGVGSRKFLQHGYAMVIADTRGHGASSGNALTFGFRYQQDAGEVIDWIAAQPWSDGHVGMIGGSHVGWTQLAAAAQRPAALKAIMPAVVPMEGFTGQFFPGGIYMQGFLNGVGRSDSLGAVAARRARRTPAPVVDEDGDGELADEIPLDLDGSGDFMDDYKPEGSAWPPEYADGNERSHIYFRAFVERPPVPGFDWAAKPFIDTRATSGETGRDLCANLAAGIAGSGVAVYNVGGWFDGFARGTTELYATLAPTNPSRLLMFPGYHNLVRGFMYDEFGADPGDLLTERLRFFDHYLKGIDNGIDREPAVLIYNMHGDGWRQENEWPLARQKITRLYPAAAHTLTLEPGGPDTDTYTVNLGHDRRYGSNLSSRWMALMAVAPDTAPDMTRMDTDALVYTGAVLEADTEVTGHPVARLWTSSSAPGGDVFVYLEDVDENGRSLMVTEGQLRAGWAALHDNDLQTDFGLEVLPELPWHGYESSQWQPDIFAGGEPVELVIDLQPTSWTFRRGHRIRLAITGANWPDFQLHPALSPGNDPRAKDNVVAVMRIHRGGELRSSLDLPVIPR